MMIDDVVTSSLAFRLGSGAFGCSRAKKINSGLHRSGAGTSVHNLTMDTLISTEGKLVWTSLKQPEINPKMHSTCTNHVGTETMFPSQPNVSVMTMAETYRLMPRYGRHTTSPSAVVSGRDLPVNVLAICDELNLSLIHI